MTAIEYRRFVHTICIFVQAEQKRVLGISSVLNDYFRNSESWAYR